MVPLPSLKIIGLSWGCKDEKVKTGKEKLKCMKRFRLCDCLTWPAVKMATLRSLWPRKARLLVGKWFSCSALPVAKSKTQYRTQLPVSTQHELLQDERKQSSLSRCTERIHNKKWDKNKQFTFGVNITAKISAFSGIQVFRSALKTVWNLLAFHQF